MKLPIQNGGCAGRLTCKNVNKKICNPMKIRPRNILFGLIKKGYVECDYYEKG